MRGCVRLGGRDRGGVQSMQDEVFVVGYPIGGDSVSVTQGVVSRVEPQQYAHGSTVLLAVQIDAAINQGNSGGPAFKGDRVIGMAFQNLVGASNIGFIIPVPIIRHFLQDVQGNGYSYTGFCQLGVMTQPTENKFQRKFLGIEQSQEGVIVNKSGLGRVCLPRFPGCVEGKFLTRLTLPWGIHCSDGVVSCSLPAVRSQSRP